MAGEIFIKVLANLNEASFAASIGKLKSLASGAGKDMSDSFDKANVSAKKLQDQVIASENEVTRLEERRATAAAKAEQTELAYVKAQKGSSDAQMKAVSDLQIAKQNSAAIDTALHQNRLSQLAAEGVALDALKAKHASLTDQKTAADKDVERRTAGVSDVGAENLANKATNAAVAYDAYGNRVNAASDAHERHAEVVQNTGDKLDGLQDKASQAHRSLMLVGTGAAVMGAGIVGEGVKISSQVQDNMQRLVALGQESQNSVGAMSQQVYQLATQVPFTVQELSKTLQQVENSGYRGQDALNLLNSAAKTATIGHTDLKDTVVGLSTSLVDFKVPLSDVNVMAGQLAATLADLKGSDPSQLFRALGTVEPQARTYMDKVQGNVASAQVNSAFDVLSQIGIEPEQASHNISRIIATLGGAGEKSSNIYKMLGQLGIKPEDIATQVQTQGFAPAFSTIQNAIAGKTDANGMVNTGFRFDNKQLQDIIQQDKDQLAPEGRAYLQSHPEIELGVAKPFKEKDKLLESIQGAGLSPENAQDVLTLAQFEAQAHGQNPFVKAGGESQLTQGQVSQLMFGTGDIARTGSTLMQNLGLLNSQIEKILHTGDPGEFMKSFNAAMDSNSKQFAQLKADAGAVSGRMANDLLPVLQTVVHGFGDMLSFFERHKTLGEALLAAMGGLVASAVFVKIVGSISTLISTFETVGKAFGWSKDMANMSDVIAGFKTKTVAAGTELETGAATASTGLKTGAATAETEMSTSLTPLKTGAAAAGTELEAGAASFRTGLVGLLGAIGAGVTAGLTLGPPSFNWAQQHLMPKDQNGNPQAPSDWLYHHGRQFFGLEPKPGGAGPSSGPDTGLFGGPSSNTFGDNFSGGGGTPSASVFGNGGSGGVVWHADWNATAQRESSGNWHNADTGGNGHYGGLQFSPSSWEAAGGLQFAPRADLATPYQQALVAEKLLAMQGPGAWTGTFVPGSSGPSNFARGGVLPGYSPGRDDMLIAVSGGEGILVPEAVKALGPGFVHRINSYYTARRSGRGRQFDAGGIFGPGIGGGPGVGNFGGGPGTDRNTPLATGHGGYLLGIGPTGETDQGLNIGPFGLPPKGYAFDPRVGAPGFSAWGSPQKKDRGIKVPRTPLGTDMGITQGGWWGRWSDVFRDSEDFPGGFHFDSGGVVSADGSPGITPNWGNMYAMADSLQGVPYGEAGGLLDCSGTAGVLIQSLLGQTPGAGDRLNTGNASGWLPSHGFLMGRPPGPGYLEVGWYNGGPGGGHMAMTLPTGQNAEQGGGTPGDKFTIGASAAGAENSEFSEHAYYPYPINDSLGVSGMDEFSSMMGPRSARSGSPSSGRGSRSSGGGGGGLGGLPGGNPLEQLGSGGFTLPNITRVMTTFLAELALGNPLGKLASGQVSPYAWWASPEQLAGTPFGPQDGTSQYGTPSIPGVSNTGVNPSDMSKVQRQTTLETDKSADAWDRIVKAQDKIFRDQTTRAGFQHLKDDTLTLNEAVRHYNDTLLTSANRQDKAHESGTQLQNQIKEHLDTLKTDKEQMGEFGPKAKQGTKDAKQNAIGHNEDWLRQHGIDPATGQAIPGAQDPLQRNNALAASNPLSLGGLIPGAGGQGFLGGRPDIGPQSGLTPGLGGPKAYPFAGPGPAGSPMPSRQPSEPDKGGGGNTGGNMFSGLASMAASAAGAMAPGAGGAASVAAQEASRLAGYLGQLAGIGVEGVLETFLPNDSPLADPTKSLPGKVLTGIAGAHPNLPNAAGGTAPPLKPQGNQNGPMPGPGDAQQGQGKDQGPNLNITNNFHGTNDNADQVNKEQNRGMMMYGGGQAVQ